MNFRDLRTLIRKTLLNDDTIQGLVGDRIYPAQFASVDDPVMPCGNFALRGGSPDTDVRDVGYFSMPIWTWHKSTFEDAYEVYEAIRSVLDNEAIKGPGATPTIAFVFKEISLPLEARDPVTNAYYLMVNWRGTVLNLT